MSDWRSAKTGLYSHGDSHETKATIYNQRHFQKKNCMFLRSSHSCGKKKDELNWTITSLPL